MEALVAAHVDGIRGRQTLANRLLRQLRSPNNPAVNFTLEDLLQQLEARSESLSAIESFLMANWVNEDEPGSVQALAESTLAFHTATDEQRIALVQLFQALAQNISAAVPEIETRKMFSRNLFGVAESNEIKLWVGENVEPIAGCSTTLDLLRIIWPLMERFVKNRNFANCTPHPPLLKIAEAWIDGQPFNALLQILVDAAARIGQRHPTIIHVVDICEGGLGFDGMLIVGAVADNFETIRPGETDVPDLLRQLQKQIRYGLPSDNTIRFYEMGFADRAIALSLSDQVPVGRDRQGTIFRLRQHAERVTEILSSYPSYFTMILSSLTRTPPSVST